MLGALTQELNRGISLSDEGIGGAVEALVDPAFKPEEKADFLVALARKGETNAEIAGFARRLREKAILPPVDESLRAGPIVDVCGTGGDRLNTFNISTAVALLVAAAGVPVAKHGNRAITSQSGSADVLEALGVRIDLSPEEAAQALREHGFCFLFAPHYHPAFREIGPARKLCAERGERTVFNFLGPLLNPVRPTAQLVGVPRPALCEPIGQVLQSLGVRRGMVVSGQVLTEGVGPAESSPPTLDEISTLGPSTVAEFYQDRGFHVSELIPEHFPLQAARLADLEGGSREENAAVIRELLQGKDRGPRRDAMLLNAAAALLVADQVTSLTQGWEKAAELIDSGKAAAKLKDLQAL